MQRSRETLLRPRHGMRARVEGLELPLAAGSLTWTRGICRTQVLQLDGDSLVVMEFTGRGYLQLTLPDSLERLSIRAQLGSRADDGKLRRVTIVLPRLPAACAGLDWTPLKGKLPFLRPAGFREAKHLALVHPDHPLLMPRQSDSGADWLWLKTDPGDWIWIQREGGCWLTRPLHPGSQLMVPVARTEPGGAQARSAESAWVPPTLAQPGGQILEQRLKLGSDGIGLTWILELQVANARAGLFLLLDPRAKLLESQWLHPDGGVLAAPHNRQGANAGNPGKWLVLEGPEGPAPDTLSLRLAGTSIRDLSLRRAPGQWRAERANWFPRTPWWQPPVPFAVEDPESILSAWLLEEASTRMQGFRLDGRAPQRLVPQERPPVSLGPDVILDWTPLRQLVEGNRPAPAQFPRHVPELGNLDLPRERSVRPTGHEPAPEPVDLMAGRDTLSSGMLQEGHVVAELQLAVTRLKAWLGNPPHPVLLHERLGPSGMRDHEDLLFAHDLPPEPPIEILARDLRDASPRARLARLEALCRGWWEAPTMEAALAPRWIRHGAARACALLLLEDQGGRDQSLLLRRQALDRELNRFRAHASSSLPALGERAEGAWRSDEVQDRLAWRFTLLLEHLRWRMRDPFNLDDSTYRAFLAELALRLQDPATPGRPLAELEAALTGFLVANELLDRAGFTDVPALRSWLESEWTRSDIPMLTASTGMVKGVDGNQLALRLVWDADPPPSTVLPVLVQVQNEYFAYSLKAVSREEQFLLPLDPAQVTGLELAPGGTLMARIRVD